VILGFVFIDLFLIKLYSYFRCLWGIGRQHLVSPFSREKEDGDVVLQGVWYRLIP